MPLVLSALVESQVSESAVSNWQMAKNIHSFKFIQHEFEFDAVRFRSVAFPLQFLTSLRNSWKGGGAEEKYEVVNQANSKWGQMESNPGFTLTPETEIGKKSGYY